MSTTPVYSARYGNMNVSRLVEQLEEQARFAESARKKLVKKDRKTHQSCCEMQERNKSITKPVFNNKTQNETKLFEPQLKSTPYMFIPKYKHDNFIIPDRAFAKGKQAKRFHVKMKDTSVYSFREAESQKLNKHLSKSEKQKTIVSRKFQELERILDKNDGKIKAKHNRWFLQNRKTFKPSSNISQTFSNVDPMLEPKDIPSIEMRKTSLRRTFDHKGSKWKPTLGGSTKTFSATVGNSFYTSSARGDGKNMPFFGKTSAVC